MYKKLLIDRLNSWTETKASEFHDFKFTSSNEDRKYIWENIREGIILYRDNSAIFFSGSGTIYKVSEWSNLDGWASHNKLYEVMSDEYIIEKPVKAEKILNNYLYTEVLRPYESLGTTLFELLLLESITYDRLYTYIRKYSALISDLKKIDSFYPFPPKPVFYDNEVCFTDFKYWRYREKDFYDISLEVLQITFNEIKTQNDQIDTENLLTEAKKLWKI